LNTVPFSNTKFKKEHGRIRLAYGHSSQRSSKWLDSCPQVGKSKLVVAYFFWYLVESATRVGSYSCDTGLILTTTTITSRCTCYLITYNILILTATTITSRRTHATPHMVHRASWGFKQWLHKDCFNSALYRPLIYTPGETSCGILAYIESPRKLF
jgi:hypothetical protein